MRTGLTFLGVVVILAALVAVVAIPAWSPFAGFGQASQVPTYEVRRGEFVRRVLADGNLDAVNATQLTLSARIRGSVTVAWMAPDGSTVAEGDVVMRFDPTDMERKLADGQSERAATEQRIVQKESRGQGDARKLERDSGLADLALTYAEQFQTKDAEIFSRNEVIEAEIDQELARHRKTHAAGELDRRDELTTVELELLEIERRKAQMQIDQARTELEELEVRAPHDGIFVAQSSWRGPIQVGAVVWAGNPVGEIPQLEEMQAEVFVLEADAGGLESGVEAVLRLDAHPGRVFSGKVKNVDALAKRRNRSVPVQYFGVTVSLDETDPTVMKPGQRVEAELTLDRLDSVLTIPRQAVFRESGKTFVYVRRGAEFEATDVELGAAGLGRVVVESGLDEGDLVALRDPTRPVAPATDEGADAGSAGSVGAGL